MTEATSNDTFELKIIWNSEWTYSYVTENSWTVTFIEASREKYKCRHRPKKRGILFYTETTIEEVYGPNLLQPYNNLSTKFIPDDELQNKSN